MLIGAVIGICVLLAILGFLVPRLSNHARRGTDKGFSVGQRAGGKAPGPIGRLLSKSFGKSRRAADKSHSGGQKARSKLPFKLQPSPWLSRSWRTPCGRPDRRKRRPSSTRRVLSTAALARPPHLVSTFSLWRSAAEMREYAVRDGGPHSAAVRTDRERGFHRESAFIRFRPYASQGTWEGRDPLARS